MEKPRESFVSGDVSSLGEAPSFEDALEELESIVERMEDGESSLEDSLKLFERGMNLTRRCQKALDDAEQRIRTLADESPPVEADAAEGSAADG